MCCLLSQRQDGSQQRDSNTHFCMGDPRLVSCTPDYYQTLLWTATISDRINVRRLVHSVSTKSCVILCSVSLAIWMSSACFAEVSNLLGLLLFLASASARCLQISLCADPWLTLASDNSSFHSTQLPWETLLISVFFKLCNPFRCLCWDHVSSLASENTTPSGWPAPASLLACMQMSSRGAGMYPTVLVCNTEQDSSDWPDDGHLAGSLSNVYL
jgi:hypothetical protein